MHLGTMLLAHGWEGVSGFSPAKPRDGQARLYIGIADGMPIARGPAVPVLETTASPRRSFWEPARPYPRDGRAVGDAEMQLGTVSLSHGWEGVSGFSPAKPRDG